MKLESITDEIGRFNDVKCKSNYSKNIPRTNAADSENVLELDRRYRNEHENRIKAHRFVAQQKLKEKGFPILIQKCFDPNDYLHNCLPDQALKEAHRRYPDVSMRKWSDKPQNANPKDLINLDQEEIAGKVVRVNEPYKSDRLMRAAYNASLRGSLSSGQEYNLSNVFPQRKAQKNFRSDVSSVAKNYLYSSEYQASYGKIPQFASTELCRKVFPLTHLQSLPNPLRSIAGFSYSYPSTSSWQPDDFNASKFDQSLPRYDHLNEPRPYEFSTHAPRIDQITSYSGCYGTTDRRVDDDNPYKPYNPMTKVRSTYPSFSCKNLQQNIPGYTGYVKDHVKETKPVVN